MSQEKLQKMSIKCWPRFRVRNSTYSYSGYRFITQPL
ncbi:unnamed protein product [Tenebrio molitor]|nr:unnamed protein product [Tenebrio molitor]